MGILVGVVIVGIMLAAVSRMWVFAEQRDRENRLLDVGHEMRWAIAAYYAHVHHYPLSLEDLLGDPESTLPRRYLRRVYADPVTGTPDWELLLAPGEAGIMGVASKSKLIPIKRARFSPVDATFEDADCYCSWQFVYVPRHSYRSNAPASPTR